MKKMLILASCLAIAACTEAPEDEAVAETEVAAPAPAEQLGGEYTVTNADGTSVPVTINEDGTWSGTNAEGEEESGTWRQADGKTCFAMEGTEGEECWTDSPADADGSFTSTSDTGETVTVTPSAATTE